MTNKSKTVDIAIDLLIKQVKGLTKSDILHTNFLANGYTNKSFKIKTIKGTYIVRLGSSDKLLHRNNEYYVYQIIKNKKYCDLIYFDIKTGNQIRKWIDGILPNHQVMHSYHFYDLLIKEIKYFHNIKKSKLKNIEINNFFEYDNLIPNKDKKYKDLAHQLINYYQHNKATFSHNDLTPWNMIYNKQTDSLFFIDYEWSRMNYEYFDLANFIREAKIHNTKYEQYFINNFDKSFTHKDITRFIFISCYYSYAWSFSMKPYKNIVAYRNKVYKIMLNIYQEILAKKYN